MADRPLSIDIRHPLLLKANDLALLTRQDGDVPQPIPGFGLFYRDTCYLEAYALRLHGMAPLLLMASDSEGMAARMHLTNSRLRTLNGQAVADHKLSLCRTFLVLGEEPVFIDIISIRNFSDTRVILPLSLEFAHHIRKHVRATRRAAGQGGLVARPGMGREGAALRL